MLNAILFAFLGYISGSVLYANIFGTLFGKKELYKNSPDKNPGTANAYKYGGFWCGTLTLICDLLKGALPVFLYQLLVPGYEEWSMALVLAAPILGHIFSVFYKFHGGKGIAATFGCLLGLFPYLQPLFLFAAVFIFLSVGLRINPNLYRTIAAYMATVICMILAGIRPSVWVGFLIIAVTVCLRLYMSKEEKERFEVKLLWMR